MSADGGPSVGHDGLRDLPLRDLLEELERVERLLREGDGSPSDAAGQLGRLGRDLTVEALRCRERAVEAEILRRPGGFRRRSLRRSESDAPPE